MTLRPSIFQDYFTNPKTQADLKKFFEDYVHESKTIKWDALGVIVDDQNDPHAQFKTNIPFRKYESENKVIVLITRTIPEGCLEKVILYFKDHEKATDILFGTIGHGFTEEHIVTTYASFDEKNTQKIEVFDSKWSNLNKFFSNGPPENLEYHTLGTQSIFDPDTCGYHTLFNLLACMRLFKDKKSINTQNILEELQKSPQSPVIDVNNILQESTHFSTFMKQALKQTYCSDIGEEDAVFSSYFLGFPKTGSSTFDKCIFIISFEWLLVPLMNILKLPSIFLMNILAESINYIKDRVLEFAPTDMATQSLRTIGLFVINLVMYVFKTLALLFNLILSPQETAKKAYDIHPILGVLSAIASLSSYAALSIFAGPLLAAFAPPLLIKILASPLLSIWSNLNAGVSASLLLTVAFGLGSGLKWILDKLFNVSETTSTSVSSSTNNVSETTSTSDDDFVEVDSPLKPESL